MVQAILFGLQQGQVGLNLKDCAPSNRGKSSK